MYACRFVSFTYARSKATTLAAEVRRHHHTSVVVRDSDLPSAFRAAMSASIFTVRSCLVSSTGVTSSTKLKQNHGLRYSSK
jgi:hypothetical protein